MKKLILVLVLAAIITTGTAFADHPGGFGIGIVGGAGGGWGGGWYPNWGLSLVLPSVPIFWVINMHVDSNVFSIGLSGDKYIVDQDIADKVVGWYFGIGGWANITLANEAYFGFGARLPIGLSIQPIPLLELFLEIAPSLGVQVNPFYFPAGGWGGAFGLRLWF